MVQGYDKVDMPPLTEDMQSELRGIENTFRQKLANCCRNYRVVDEVAAFEYVRTYAVKFFSCFYDFYSEFPKYRGHWAPASEAFAYQRTVKCIEDIDTIRSFFYSSSDHVKRIKSTIAEQSSTKSPPLLQKVEWAPPISVPKASPFVETLINARKLLFQSYQARFPHAHIIDICWAARQHRREWDRWLKGEIRDGLTPDRAFKSVLKSEKEPTQIRREVRPKNWK